MQEAGATIQKGSEEGSEEVEGPAEVAAHMCLQLFVVYLMRLSVNCITLFNKDVSRTGSICFHADRLASHTL